MKCASVSYHRDFPATPMSAWEGAAAYRWASIGGRGPTWVPNPFLRSLPVWCKLRIDFNGVQLVFATPRELDRFIEVMSQNPLPSGPRLYRYQFIGRPKGHWLARLPARAKPAKFRKQLLVYIDKTRATRVFRDFYANKQLVYEFEGLYETGYDAILAQADTSASSLAGPIGKIRAERIAKMPKLHRKARR